MDYHQTVIFPVHLYTGKTDRSSKEEQQGCNIFVIGVEYGGYFFIYTISYNCDKRYWRVNSLSSLNRLTKDFSKNPRNPAVFMVRQGNIKLDEQIIRNKIRNETLVRGLSNGDGRQLTKLLLDQLSLLCDDILF